MTPTQTFTRAKLMIASPAGTHTVFRALSILDLIFHATVRSVRKSHGNAIIGLFQSILQAVILVGVFYIMFSILGLRGTAIRGDFLLYLMSGIFLFMTHTKAMSAVLAADGPTSPMMKHAPMNTIISITSSTLASLYIQILSMVVVVFMYHAIFQPIEIDRPAEAMGMVLLSWAAGVAVGMVFLALRPWAPGFVSVAAGIYARANMIASGKMFVANTMPGYVLAYFDWNPLFHAIDQARGFTFINYNPIHSEVAYPLVVTVCLMFAGLMGEFYSRQKTSLSWSAGR